jgi:hypothetical protein
MTALRILLSCLPAVGIGLTWIAYEIRKRVNRWKQRRCSL